MPSGAKARTYLLESMIKRMDERSSDLRTGVDEVQALLARVDARIPPAAALVHEAKARIDFVLMDNSKGAHNYERAHDLIEEAKTLARRAARSGAP